MFLFRYKKKNIVYSGLTIFYLIVAALFKSRNEKES